MAAEPWHAPWCQAAIQLLGPLCATLLRAGFGSERLPSGEVSLSQSGWRGFFFRGEGGGEKAEKMRERAGLPGLQALI